MSDRELLELAAKAIGIELKQGFGEPPENCMFYQTHGGAFTWNPLLDDGLALRIAVRLKIQIQPWDEMVDAGLFPFVTMQELYGTDPYAATRRAIVRVAAEIGKGME